MIAIDILFVTAYPPPFDARTLAAVEHVRALRDAGHRVEVMSPSPSAAHRHHDVASWWDLPTLAVSLRRFDRVVVSRDLADAAPLGLALHAARSVETWDPPPRIPRALDHDVTAAEEWPSARDATMKQIRARAARREGSSQAGGRDLGALLRRIPPLALPAPDSTRPGAAAAKRLVRRLTGWQVDPVVARVNLIRATLVQAFELVERKR